MLMMCDLVCVQVETSVFFLLLSEKMVWMKAFVKTESCFSPQRILKFKVKKKANYQNRFRHVHIF